jgi:hypothetical protein
MEKTLIPVYQQHFTIENVANTFFSNNDTFKINCMNS